MTAKPEDEALLPQIGSRWQHKKRGTTYIVVANKARIQTGTQMKDDEFAVVYVGEHGDYGVRSPAEFMDGRFAALSPKPVEPHAHIYHGMTMPDGSRVCTACGHIEAKPSVAPEDEALPSHAALIERNRFLEGQAVWARAIIHQAEVLPAALHRAETAESALSSMEDDRNVWKASAERAHAELAACRDHNNRLREVVEGAIPILKGAGYVKAAALADGALKKEPTNADAAELRALLLEAWELIDIAQSGCRRTVRDQGSNIGLPHEARMFALNFSAEGRDGPGELQVRGNGRALAWLGRARVALR